jgi:transcriptional regulator with XRE-family HTH domain
MRAIQRFGKRLQRLRTRRGLTQELAKTTGTFPTFQGVYQEAQTGRKQPCGT